MTKRAISLLALSAALAAVLVLAPDVLLIVIAGVLLAVFIHGGGSWISAKLGIGEGWGIALFLIAIVAALAGFATAAAPAVAEQANELARRLPEAFNALRDRIADYSWGQKLLDRLAPSSLAMSGAGSTAASALSTTFGALGTGIIIFFIGLYAAIDPAAYRRGLTRLLAPSLRARADEILHATAATLRNWLTAQLISMSVVGGLTALALWLAGIPLAFVLGLIAGLLAFIPNIGPVIAITPALLLAVPQGQTAMLLVLGVYVGVQALESYIITPLVQQEKVNLSPAIIITAQLFFGVLFGLLGLMLATPIAAAMITILRLAYVRDFLEHEARA
ncbi:AI-2E family transporter [Allostella sp. ATCC 35155]|nr:AI-2E family transporter [Stella sp. ATCC 35155]